MMTDKVSGTQIALRSADVTDMERVLGWRNLPEIVARGTLQRPVGRTEHEAWFSATLAAPDRRRLLVIECAGTAIGLVRFDRRDAADAEISIYLLPGETGRGRGVVAIRSGTTAILAIWDIARVLAFVRDENASGLRAFVRAGYTPVSHAACPPAHTALALKRCV